MLRILILFSLILNTGLNFAAQKSSLYQVDLIIFAQPASSQGEESLSSLVAPSTRQAILLQKNAERGNPPFRLLPPSRSQLRGEFWTLRNKSAYQVLAHYSWLQPSNNKRPVAVAIVDQNGWNVEGTLAIQQSSYYSLDANLLFSAANSNRGSFLISQKQRLKGGVVYYLDHPQAGMLIKIHKVS
ncbi:peptidoglycan binding protein CsiV [Legionella sp. 27cVA30]|uniref:CsiV family protein n=1 Tax=Legionella TaxID=445 RepID=UPI000F8CE52D|nr:MULTISPECIES: CsiV family protein [Legionella]MCP0914224.1 peptidoglycan binding protein CsiV [Legionella sp. 27cVA30]RUR17453.1 hypothetical protein ELY10_00530 [Legionella septentrionalis]